MLYEQLYRSITSFTEITTDEYDQLVSYFTCRKIQKGEFILKAGEVCKQGIFVLEGCLSYYLEDQDGNENVIDLGTSGWWMADTDSFFKGTKSEYHIKALSDAEVLLILPEKMLAAFDLHKSFLYYHYFAVLEYRKRTDKLLANALHTSAETKYLKLMSERPELFQLASLHDIASFLGLTPQSLSRLRRMMSHKPL